MKIKKKNWIVVFALFIFLFSIFLLRNFLIRWGGNLFLFPHAIYLTKVETHLSGLREISFTTEGLFHNAPLQTKGTLQLLPVRVDFQQIKISQVPAAELDQALILKCGFTVIKGTANIQAKGWAKITEIDMDINAVLFDAKVVKAEKTFLNLKEGFINFLAKNGKELHATLHMSGNRFNPDITCKP